MLSHFPLFLAQITRIVGDRYISSISCTYIWIKKQLYSPFATPKYLWYYISILKHVDTDW